MNHVKRLGHIIAGWWHGTAAIDTKSDAPPKTAHSEARPLRSETPPLRKTVHYKNVVTARSQSDAMALAKEDLLVLVVGETGTAKWLVFRCPCGCREIRRVSLSRAVRPHWRYRIDDKNRISLYPSVRLERECAAHFVMRDNVAYVYRY